VDRTVVELEDAEEREMADDAPEGGLVHAQLTRQRRECARPVSDRIWDAQVGHDVQTP